MTGEFRLPGAERFSQYLEETLRGRGVLTARGPKITDDGRYCEEWIVELDGVQLGEYCRFSPKPGEAEFVKEFQGRIPGYKNKSIIILNKERPESERKPEDLVRLTYANREFEQGGIRRRHGGTVNTPWRRLDCHDHVPFP